eukprot:scaffold19986_cov35-Prasinocladus_malaysianus.AAC.1
MQCWTISLPYDTRYTLAWCMESPAWALPGAGVALLGAPAWCGLRTAGPLTWCLLALLLRKRKLGVACMKYAPVRP